MKKYTQLGELLKDYRQLNNVSQADLSTRMNVGIRTLIRWENNETLIKSEKEEELVEETFIPYQVIRNLNAIVAIPVYYDFRIRKYSYSEMSNELPEASWLKTQINLESTRSRAIEKESDADEIIRYTNFFYPPLSFIGKDLILKAATILPELNQILFDPNGYYAGHCVVFPIKKEVYNKIIGGEMMAKEIDSSCFTTLKPHEETVFLSYNITADCNENIFYILCPLLKYFNEYEAESYTFAGYALRADGFQLLEHFGLKQVWESEETLAMNGFELRPRFYEGDFKEFLKD